MKKNKTALLLAAVLVFGNTGTVWAGEEPSAVQEEVTGESAAPAGEPEEQASGQIVIYHTNDSHGYLAGDGESVVGIDQVAGLKEATPGSILIDAGDATQGLPLASLTQGADVIELMNLAGYDLMTAGNHEFDFGADQFLANAALADFPILAANVYRNGSPLLEGVQEGNSGCHALIESNGIQIGFFGLTTVQTASATNPEGIQGLEFRDEAETARKEIDELEEAGADVIIAVCHLGDGDAPCTSADLAESLTGDYQDKVDVIIDGHSHTVENTEVNGITIVQTGCNMAAVGRLTLEYEGEVTGVTEELLTPADLTEVTADPEVAAKLAEIQASQEEQLQEVIGEIDTSLWAGWIGNIGLARLEETNYGNLAADALKAAAEAFQDNAGGNLPVIAAENGGGVREPVANGTVTRGDLLSTFPFSNTLYMKIVTPEILYQVMEVSASCLDGQDPETGMLLQQTISGGFLQIAGFRVVYDPDAETGNRVVSITLDGQETPLDPGDGTTQILMVSNNYIMSGGSDYTMLGELPKYGEAGGELEAIESYLKSCLEDGAMETYRGTQGRILMRGNGYEGGDYTGAIRILDEGGNPLAGQALSYRIDGGERVNGVTDEEGFLRIQLREGAHGIRLADSQQEIYVSNYSGLGLAEDGLRAWPELTFLADGSCDPVGEPTQEPTEAPTQEPTQEPTGTLTPEPTVTAAPTEKPADTDKPTSTPGPATAAPTAAPDKIPAADTGDGGYTLAAALLSGGLAGALLLGVLKKRNRA